MSSISVVIPVFNEIESLPELISQLRSALKHYSTAELIFIDDGCTDGSFEYLQERAAEDKNICLIQFHRNYGKSAALAEGFKLASGDFIVTMDADLQDDPAEIVNLQRKIDAGFDLVSGWKKQRNDPFTKTFPSKVWNFLTRLMTGVKIHDFNCGLKMYRKAVIKSIDIYGGRHRYIPALAGQKKFRVSEIVVNHRPRIHGTTKYGGARFFHGIFDLITIMFLSRYTQQPLHLFGSIGFLSTTVGFIAEFYVLYLKYIVGNPFKQHMALIILGVMLIVIGIQFISLGLLGEMIAHSTQGQEDRVKCIIS
ncbi:MAG: glycosyltransferase family 2 protein [Candidatus Neomarinimicrobiota bacterium]